ncbi:MAG: flagellar basal body rod C-terminal domain-containing protein [bacterium]
MSLLDAIDIGTTGLITHEQRLEVHAKNIANTDTPNYVRKIPVVMAQDDVSFNGLLNRMKENVFNVGTLPHLAGGVTFNGVVEDPTPGDMIYKPGHPDADANGYIRASNVNPLVDMADATLASRAYEASMAVVSMTKAMAQKAVEIGR